MTDDTPAPAPGSDADDLINYQSRLIEDLRRERDELREHDEAARHDIERLLDNLSTAEAVVNKLTRKRDEARAEVVRLRGVLLVIEAEDSFKLTTGGTAYGRSGSVAHRALARRRLTPP